METERLLACDFGRILYLPSYVVPVYWLKNTVSEERDRETVFDNDHSVGEGRGNLQRLRPIGEEVAEASRRIHQELGPCRRCQVKKT